MKINFPPLDVPSIPCTTNSLLPGQLVVWRYGDLIRLRAALLTLELEPRAALLLADRLREAVESAWEVVPDAPRWEAP